MFGAQLRVLRTGRGMSAAALGELVFVSGDLISKIEKAERRAQPDLVARLDAVLETNGALVRLAAEIGDGSRSEVGAEAVELPAEVTAPMLRSVIGQIRDGDHTMASVWELPTVLAYARAAEQVSAGLRGGARDELRGLIAQAYQLAGWMCFDHAEPSRATTLLSTARHWAGHAEDAALVAFVLGPSASFAATWTGNPALGVELGYGALGWARRSGNARLAAFILAITARAHARLGEARLCLELLDQAGEQLGRHVDDEGDPEWLAVFDAAALDGHRGSCLLDLGLPDQAVSPLQHPATVASGSRFLRNRILWQLDRAHALLRLGDLDQACAAVDRALTLATPGGITPRVRLRFAGVGLALREQVSACPAGAAGAALDCAERIDAFTAVNA